MSIRLMAIVWDSALPHDEKFVALALADWADDNGGSLYPSQERIAVKVSKSSRAVRETLGKLYARGVLEVLQRGGGERSSTYRFNAKALPMRPVNGPSTQPEDSSGTHEKPEETSYDPSDVRDPDMDQRRSDGSAEETSGIKSKPEDSSGTKKRKASIARALELNETQARLAVEARDILSVAFRGRAGSQTQKRRVASLIRLGATREDFEYAIAITKEETRDDDYAFALGVVGRCVKDRNDGRNPYERAAKSGRGSGRPVRRGGARARSGDRSGDAGLDGRGGTAGDASRRTEEPAARFDKPID